MFVFPDNEPEPPGRVHPWTEAVKNSEWRYHDFKQHPELIRTVLEDFVPYTDEAAVAAF